MCCRGRPPGAYCDSRPTPLLARSTGQTYARKVRLKAIGKRIVARKGRSPPWCLTWTSPPFPASQFILRTPHVILLHRAVKAGVWVAAPNSRCESRGGVTACPAMAHPRCERLTASSEKHRVRLPRLARETCPGKGSVAALSATRMNPARHLRPGRGSSLEPMVGFEPTTCRLRIGCSTAELHWRGLLPRGLRILARLVGVAPPAR